MHYYIAYNKVLDKYIGKPDPSKDSWTGWYDFPIYYPTIKGVKMGITSRLHGYTLADIEVLELSSAFTIVARYPADSI